MHLNESSADIVMEEWFYFLFICTEYQMWIIWWLLSECHDTPSKLRRTTCTNLWRTNLWASVTRIMIVSKVSRKYGWSFVLLFTMHSLHYGFLLSRTRTVHFILFLFYLNEFKLHYFNHSKWEIHKTAYFKLVIIILHHYLFRNTSWNGLKLDIRCLKLNALGRFPQSNMHFRRSVLIYVSGHWLWTLDDK